MGFPVELSLILTEGHECNTPYVYKGSLMLKGYPAHSYRWCCNRLTHLSCLKLVVPFHDPLRFLDRGT